MSDKPSFEKLHSISSFVSKNPKKIIAIFLIFTLIMGYYASHMKTETDRSSFTPDSAKSDWLNEVQTDFDASIDGAVEISFTANNGNVFTKEVLNDMLNTKSALKKNEKVNRTLGSTSKVPSGVITLADLVVMANQTFKIQDFILNLDTESEQIKNIAKNTTIILDGATEILTKGSDPLNGTFHLNGTFNYAKQLYESSKKPSPNATSVKENTTQSLTAMGHILSHPESVKAIEDNKSEIEKLFEYIIHDIIPSNKSYEGAERHIQNNITTDPGLVYLEKLFDGMIDILKKPTSEEDELNAVFMVLSFLEIEEYAKYYPSDADLSVDTPSTSLSIQEKKKKLSNMDNDDIRKAAYNAMNYEKKKIGKKINGSIQRSEENFTSTKNWLDESLGSLGALNESVTNLSEFRGGSSEFGFDYFISNTEDELNENRSLLSTVGANLDSAKRLPDDILEISNTFHLMLTKDLNDPDTAENLKAKGSMGLIELNSSSSDEEKKVAENKIISIAEEECDHSEPRVFAWEVMMEQINDSADKSFSTLLPIALAFVAVVLLLVYRTIVETLISLLSLVFAITWTFGIGVLMGYKFNPVIIAVPVLVTGLVIDYGIHMVMRYREEKEKGNDPRKSTKISLSTVGGALVLTTVTTAIGFLSNAFSDISIMQHFGILAAIGITSSFTVMVIFLPSVIQLVDKRREKKKDDSEEKSESRISKRMNQMSDKVSNTILTKPSDKAVKHPIVVFVLILLITSTAMYGVIEIDTTFNIKDFLPEDRSQSENIEYITSNYNISNSYAYILTEGNVNSSEYLHAVSETIDNTKDDRMLMTNEEPASAVSVLQKYGTAQFGSDQYNKTIVQTFKNSDTDGDDIPEKNVTQLYDLLYSFKESIKDIEKVVYQEDDGTYPKAIIKVKENENEITKDMKNAKVMENEMIKDAKPLRKEGFTAEVTSVSIVGEDTAQELSDTQIDSLIATVIIVAILLTIVFYYLHGSKVLGVMTTVPVVLVTIWIVGTMFALGVPLNVLTVSITALTVGMGVDYSIHVTHEFTEKMQTEENHFEAMHETIKGTGSALFCSTATTIGAFGVLATSEIAPLSEFGYITALAIIYSFMVSVLVLPSWLMIWAKHFKPGKEQ